MHTCIHTYAHIHTHTLTHIHTYTPTLSHTHPHIGDDAGAEADGDDDLGPEPQRKET